MHITDDIKLLDVLHELEQHHKDRYNNAQYASVPSVVDLAVKNQSHTIVEIYSPFGYVTETLGVFEDVNCTCISTNYLREVDSSPGNVAAWVGDPLQNVDEFNDNSIDLLFIFEHTFPVGDYLTNIAPWLPKVKSETGIICGHNPGHIALSTPGMVPTECANCAHDFATINKLRLEHHITNEIDDRAFYFMYNLEQPEEGPEYIDPTIQ